MGILSHSKSRVDAISAMSGTVSRSAPRSDGKIQCNQRAREEHLGVSLFEIWSIRGSGKWLKDLMRFRRPGSKQ